jgi:hypothetical protein
MSTKLIQRKTKKDEDSSSNSEETEKEVKRTQKRVKTNMPKDTSSFGVIEYAMITPGDLVGALGNEGVFVTFDEKTCFERFYVKQPTPNKPNAFFAMRLKKRVDQDPDTFHDPMECLMSRTNMQNPISGLVIYDLSSMFMANEETVFEAECDYDEADLLKSNSEGLQTWVGPNAITWKFNEEKKEWDCTDQEPILLLKPCDVSNKLPGITNSPISDDASSKSSEVVLSGD